MLWGAHAGVDRASDIGRSRVALQVHEVAVERAAADPATPARDEPDGIGRGERLLSGVDRGRHPDDPQVRGLLRGHVCPGPVVVAEAAPRVGVEAQRGVPATGDGEDVGLDRARFACAGVVAWRHEDGRECGVAFGADDDMTCEHLDAAGVRGHGPAGARIDDRGDVDAGGPEVARDDVRGIVRGEDDGPPPGATP